ncbi:MAG TPA: diacylglycerol kinase family protein [Actinomycetota bacterium]|nr:diacylglycerol kinase family protein [Actinomycetota bacterium]
MGRPLSRPSVLRRLAAVAAILLVLLVVALTVARIVDRAFGVLVVLVAVLLTVFFGAVWYTISREGAGRHIAVVVAVGTLAGLLAVVISAPGWPLAVRGALLLLALVLGRYALVRDVRTLRALETSGVPVGPAAMAVLFINPRSGGGKAERSHLEDGCRARGIEPVVLKPGDDLRALARDAIDGGADVIGIAGGDGSQGLVASAAAERGVPMVVVPAGTRNHLAVDLGLDRNDVVGALDAFGDAVESSIDLAEVNGRVFVNNVSLGLYATIVRSPEYRDAKADAILGALPGILGPGTEPFPLGYDGPDGTHHDSAHVLQVSNGPYGRTLGGRGTRPRLDTGELGIVALIIPDDRAGRRFLSALATGRPERYPGLTSWSTPSFEVTSTGPVPVGLDGEALELEPPLRFSSRPGALRVRLPRHAIGSSPAGRARGWRSTIPDLLQTALGRPLAEG